jgi:hypothetical protein
MSHGAGHDWIMTERLGFVSFARLDDGYAKAHPLRFL